MKEFLNRTMNLERASQIKAWHFLAFLFWAISSGFLLGVLISLYFR